MTPAEEVMDFLLSQPTPEQVLALHASDTAQARLRYLLDTQREGRLSDAEYAELDAALQLDKLVMRLKIRARQKLNLVEKA